MALKFSFNKLRTAVTGFLTGTDTAGASLGSGEESVFVPKIATARNVITTAASTNYTLYSKDSGSVILIAPNDVNVTLPSAEAGMHFTFILTGTYDTAVSTIVQAAASEDFYGTLYGSSEGESAGTDADEAVSANTKIQFTTGGLAGDHVHLVSDGTGWYAQAFATVYSAITFEN